MKFDAPARILVVAAFCIAALITMVVRETHARAAGVEAMLPMEAVDPRSILSGHYVIIGLQEGLREGQSCPGELTATFEQPLTWLAFEKQGERAVLKGAGVSREEALKKGPLVVRGTATCTEFAAPEDASANDPPRPLIGTLNYDIGITRFHAAQKDALAIEKILQERAVGEDTRVFAIISFGLDGRARLKGLQIDGERVMLNWR
jgi:hypothetical protein